MGTALSWSRFGLKRKDLSLAARVLPGLLLASFGAAVPETVHWTGEASFSLACFATVLDASKLATRPCSQHHTRGTPTMWTRKLPSDPLEAANLKHAVAFVLTETGLTLVPNQLTSFDQHQLVLNAAFKRAKSAPIMR